MRTLLGISSIIIMLASSCGGAGSNGTKRLGPAPGPERSFISLPRPERPPGRYVLRDRRRLHPGAPGLCWKQLFLRDDLTDRTPLLRPGEDQDSWPRRRP